MTSRFARKNDVIADEVNSEDLSDTDSWGTDFDETKSELYSQEIEDNKINENLEAELFKNFSRSNSSEDKCISSTSEKTENAYCNVSSQNSGVIRRTGFSYLEENRTSDITNRNLSNNSNESTGAIPKAVSSRLRNINTSKDICGDTISNSNEEEAGAIPKNGPLLLKKNITSNINSENLFKQASSNNASKFGFSYLEDDKKIPVSCSNHLKTAQSSLIPASSKTNQGLPATSSNQKQKDMKRVPGKLKPEAFSFIKNHEGTALPRNTTDMKVPNNSRRNNEVIPITHAVQFKEHNTINEVVENTDNEKYEWSVPTPKDANLVDNNMNDPLTHLQNLDTRKNSSSLDCKGDQIFPVPGENQIFPVPNENSLRISKPTNLKINEDGSNMVKPPLPARPPPIFRYPAGTFSTNNTNLITKKLSIEGVRDENSRLISSPSTGLPSPTFPISNVVPRDCERISDAIQENVLDKKPSPKISRPLPPPPSIYPIAEVVPSFDENIESSCAPVPLVEKKTDQTPQLKPVPKKKPEHLHEQRLAQQIVTQYSVSNDVILSQQKVTSAISNKFGWKQPTSSERPKSYSLEDEIQSRDHGALESEKPRRTPSSPNDAGRQDWKTPKVGMLPENEEITKEFSPFDVMRQNVIDRPSLPVKLKAPQRSLSCNSLVQTFKDMGFSKRNPTDKKKRLSDEATYPGVTQDDIIKASASAVDHWKTSNDINFEDPIPLAPKPPLRKSTADPSSPKVSIAHNAWFHPVDAREGSLRLLAMKQDGAFLIRPSSKATEEIPYTACVTFAGRVLNFHIRHFKNGRYALGKEKDGEKTFSSLTELIRYHQDVPVEIKPLGFVTSASVRLLITPPR